MMMYFVLEIVNSSYIGGKMEIWGVVIGELESNRGVFIENEDIFGEWILMYFEFGIVISS